MPPPWERYRQPSEQPTGRGQGPGPNQGQGGGPTGPWTQYQTQPTAEQPAPSPVDSNPVAAAVNLFGQGISANFSDELAAGLAASTQAPFSEMSWKQVYNEQLQTERDNIRAAREQYPKLSTVANFGGAVTGAAGLMKNGITLLGRGAQTIPRMIGLGATEGAAYGAAAGIGGGETNDQRVIGALQGGGLGAIAGAFGGALAGFLGKHSAVAPALDDLRAQSQAAYRASEAVGLNVNQDAYRRFVGGTTDRLTREGYREGIYPTLRQVLREFGKEVDNAQPVSLRMLDELRKVARGAAASTNEQEARLAQILIRDLDDFVHNLSATQTTAGQLGPVFREMAIDALDDARMLWSRASKGETIEGLIARAGVRAERSGTSVDVAIRSEFDTLLRGSRNSRGVPNALRGFTNEERDAITRVVTGGPVENLLRTIGRFDPISHPLSGTAGGGVGMLAGGPAGAVAVPVLGYGARKAAEATTSRSASLVSELVRRGSPTLITPPAIAAPGIAGMASQPEVTEDFVRQKANALVDLLMRRGNTQQIPPIPYRTQ